MSRSRPAPLLTARAWRWLSIPFACGLVLYGYAHQTRRPAEPTYPAPWSLISR